MRLDKGELSVNQFRENSKRSDSDLSKEDYPDSFMEFEENLQRDKDFGDEDGPYQENFQLEVMMRQRGNTHANHSLYVIEHSKQNRPRKT